MKKLLLLTLISLLFISCSNYSVYEPHEPYNDKKYEIRIRYSKTITYDETEKYLKINKNIYNFKIVNNIFYGTYKTKINPLDVGYNLIHYKYIDTTHYFISKFKFELNNPFIRNKCYLTNFIIVDSLNNKIDSVYELWQYNNIIDIMAMKAFNDFKIK